MQNRKRDTDVQNRLLDSVGEGEGGMFRENSIETCVLSRVKQITSLGWMHKTILPVVWVPRQERRLLKAMQLAIGEFITDSSQGLPPSPRVWGWKGPEPQFSQVIIGYNY